jgi:adenosylcobinamide kinase/adenosylcobinamide-phosphate guanylyltransferase
MATKIVLVTGGAKSGKSSFVLDKVSGIIGKKAFIATAEALDEEMKERISRHQVERDDEWDTFEEPLKVHEAVVEAAGGHSAVVLDCLTIWLSNVLIGTQVANKEQRTTEQSMDELVSTIRQLKESPVCSTGAGCSELYIVSNEVGMGIVPENSLAREFRDLAGTLNQRIAELANEAYLVIAGMPLKLK